MNVDTYLQVKSKVGQIQRCSVCGEAGHKKSFHQEHLSKSCGNCKQELPISDFYTKTKKSNGIKLAHVHHASICKICSNARSAKRYRSSFTTRFGYLLASIISRCSTEKIEVSITVDDLLAQYNKQEGLCFYSGLSLSLETGNNAVSVDRVDPFGSYNPNNIVLVCWLVNSMKRQQSHDEFVSLCRIIAERH